MSGLDYLLINNETITGASGCDCFLFNPCRSDRQGKIPMNLRISCFPNFFQAIFKSSEYQSIEFVELVNLGASLYICGCLSAKRRIVAAMLVFRLSRSNMGNML